MIEAREVEPGMAVVDMRGSRLGIVEGVHDAIVELARDATPIGCTISCRSRPSAR